MAGTTTWSSTQDVFEFRGVDNLVFAEILEDSDERYLTGMVYNLSPTAEIGRTTSSSTEAHYYDNKPMIIITSTGSDEIKIVVAPPKLDIYAMITGQTFVSRLGMLVEGARKDKDFAIGYRTKVTDSKNIEKTYKAKEYNVSLQIVNKVAKIPTQKKILTTATQK